MSETEQRILSVSYGSFSVKLEGFDDPFAIMRRVTEYFRSVTSVDPSFGQKPLIEDLGVLEAMETAIFSDEITLDQEGSTLTLRPKPTESEAEQQDVFVLESTNLAPQQALQTTAETRQPAISEALLEKTNAVQADLASAPLDLSEMAQNHQEMPFVRKEMPVAPVAEQASAEVAPEHITAQDAPAETPVKRYRSLSLNDFEPVVTVKEPTPAVEPSHETADLAVSLQNQTPDEKRPLRIVRSDYAYEEPQEVATPMATPTPDKASVNPFRKFPKRETVAQPEPISAPEVTPSDGNDDLVSAYRKLRAEHG